MPRYITILITALAPTIWGTTYLVTSEWLPEGYPITVAMLRALPAGLLLLMYVRALPKVHDLKKIFILGGINISLFWICLFIAAYELPGGIAATLGATQPLMVLLFTGLYGGHRLTTRSLSVAIFGAVGVGLLVLKSGSALTVTGTVAALLGAASMATGTILSARWRGDTPLLAFTAWQLTAGGILLLPLALMLEPALPNLNYTNIAGIMWLSLAGALVAFIFWFHGIAKIAPFEISMLTLLSPVTAILLGWSILGQELNAAQTIGALIIITSIVQSSSEGKKHEHT